MVGLFFFLFHIVFIHIHIYKKLAVTPHEQLLQSELPIKHQKRRSVVIIIIIFFYLKNTSQDPYCKVPHRGITINKIIRF